MDVKYLHRLSRPIRQRTADRLEESATQADRPVATPAAPASTPETAPHRRRPVTACEACGRTLLTGEQAVTVEMGGLAIAACPLCLIRLQTEARRAAA